MYSSFITLRPEVLVHVGENLVLSWGVVGNTVSECQPPKSSLSVTFLSVACLPSSPFFLDMSNTCMCNTFKSKMKV